MCHNVLPYKQEVVKMAMTSFNFRIEEELLEKFTSYSEKKNIKRG